VPGIRIPFSLRKHAPAEAELTFTSPGVDGTAPQPPLTYDDPRLRAFLSVTFDVLYDFNIQTGAIYFSEQLDHMLGLPPGKTSWMVGVRDPDRADALIGTIDAPGGSVSTSAAYATFLTAGGKRYGHIMDPRALHPSDACLSVTTLSLDGTLADAVSTAAFVLGPQRGLALIDSFPGMAGVIVYRGDDGKPAVTTSRSLEPRFHRVSTAASSLLE